MDIVDAKPNKSTKVKCYTDEQLAKLKHSLIQEYSKAVEERVIGKEEEESPYEQTDVIFARIDLRRKQLTVLAELQKEWER